MRRGVARQRGGDGQLHRLAHARARLVEVHRVEEARGLSDALPRCLGDVGGVARRVLRVELAQLVGHETVPDGALEADHLAVGADDGDARERGLRLELGGLREVDGLDGAWKLDEDVAEADQVPPALVGARGVELAADLVEVKPHLRVRQRLPREREDHAQP